MDSESNSDMASPALKPETLDRIDKLLVQHEWKGVQRGLFSIQDLKTVRALLQELAGWLEQNKPDFMAPPFDPAKRYDEKTVLCIAYVDHIKCANGKKPAAALQAFFNSHLADKYSHLHILPHFPSPVIHEDVDGPAARADGGFEAMSYKMDEAYGTPEDLQAVQGGLMFDFVLNHLSVHGEWFQKFLNDEPGYEDFFVTLPEEKLKELDLTPVFRPREHYPVVTFENDKGERKHVWCTFSETQADLNVKNPRVFCALLEALVKDFIGQGASWVRLDAIGYLVKMLGLNEKEALTNCFGLKETHNVLKALNAYLADIAPQVTLVPEVNATTDVLETYYGEHNDEGHLVYDFPSAPVSVYAIYRQDARAVLQWAEHRAQNPDWIGLSFTNSHDGIGVLPMADVPDTEEGQSALDFLLHQIERRGGGINYKSKIVDGQTIRVPYEACITWLQAILSPPESAALRGDRMEDRQFTAALDRFMASQSFIYSAPHCVPADYMGVTCAQLNDEALYEMAGHRRNKNRGVVNAQEFDRALNDPQSQYDHLRRAIYQRKKAMIDARRVHRAFSPYAACMVDIVTGQGSGVSADPAKAARPVFSVLREDPDGQYDIVCMTNCSESQQTVMIKSDYYAMMAGRKVVDILDDHKPYLMDKHGPSFTLEPYQVMWVRIEN